MERTTARVSNSLSKECRSRATWLISMEMRDGGVLGFVDMLRNICANYRGGYMMRKCICSFCGNTPEKVQKMIAGENAFICDQCVFMALRCMVYPLPIEEIKAPV